MSQLLIGLEEIARYIGVSLPTIKRKSPALQEAGVIFAMWRGSPPRVRICAFTNRLEAWLTAASVKND